MPLVQVAGGASKASDDQTTPSLRLSNRDLMMGNVETTAIERRELFREIRAVGKVQFNETALATVTSRVDGYIEKLFVDITGIDVNVGDHLAEIFSPQLIDQQVELLFEQSLQKRGQGEARKVRLLRLGMTVEQVDKLLSTSQVNERITLLSPIKGTVVEKLVVRQSAVKAGDILYKIADLDSVWLYLDIYESEIASVRYGQIVKSYAEAYPGEVFLGFVWFISPILNEESRTVKVLVTIPNKHRRLKPGMFVSADIRSALLSDGTAGPTGAEGLWTCPMHPQVLVRERGQCPYCKMELTQIPAATPQISEADLRVLAVPISAVLDSGTRKIVYQELAKGEFIPVALQLGPRAGDFFPVLSGLREGDRVAVRGNFLIDSQAQIAGLPSLFQDYAAGASKDNLTSGSQASARPGDKPGTTTAAHKH